MLDVACPPRVVHVSLHAPSQREGQTSPFFLRAHESEKSRESRALQQWQPLCSTREGRLWRVDPSQSSLARDIQTLSLRTLFETLRFVGHAHLTHFHPFDGVVWESACAKTCGGSLDGWMAHVSNPCAASRPAAIWRLLVAKDAECVRACSCFAEPCCCLAARIVFQPHRALI
jgi:hypothetical protein